MTAIDTAAYLDRIGYDGPLDPTVETLGRLHVTHLLAVPFENLSIHWNEPIVLDDEALFDKIVRRRRGGFCYELNGLFAALLRALGFDVVMLSAGVMNDRGEFGPDFDHMALMVTLDRPWLADVGFGESFRLPLPLDSREPHEQHPRSYRIDEDGGALVLAATDGDVWRPQYRFTLEPRRYAEYAEMCAFHQTSPESHFTRKRICTLATADGRETLSDRMLIVTRDGDRIERELASQDEVDAELANRFGILR